MKVTCHCGHLLVDSTDGHPHKAYFIPDQNWLALFDGIDEQVLVPLERGKIREEAASMKTRELIGKPARTMYQCRECGRLYVDDSDGRLHCFLPADNSVPREILRSTE
ncbi:hypothetical protein SH661x_003212 [Planctomicrobium sp. SH661]|uniref:hypothetical protein n=1 Tax=Planctomicrobium sp. SH661 TaxID=3448124 RepID=UPI003F5C846B